MDWKNILGLFSDTHPEQIKELKTMNNERFLESIIKNDWVGIEESLSCGLDVGFLSFWQKLHSMPHYEINKDTYEFLLKSKLPNIKVDLPIIQSFPGHLRTIMSSGTTIKEDTFQSAYIITQILKEKIIDNLIAEKTTFDEGLFFLAKEYVDSSKISRNSLKIIHKIGKGDISQYSDKLHDFIIDKNLVSHLLDGINNSKSLEFFREYKNYANYLKYASEDRMSGVMNYAISNAQIEKVRVLHNLGVSISNCEKGSYAQLFMMTSNEGNKAQDFVIKHIDDITVGGHVIFKTLVHSKVETADQKFKLELINQVLERYSDDKIGLIPGLLLKRPDTERVLFVKKYYDHRVLKMELNNELSQVDRDINSTNKKLKL
jgi:hypothetical protein